MAPTGTGLGATDEHGSVAGLDAEYGAVSLACRIRVLAVAALGPLVTGYAAVAAVLALVTAVASRAHFSTVGVFTAAAPGWLAAHQVPVLIEGHELGVLPLLPTIVAVLLIARTAAGAAERLEVVAPRQAGEVILAIVCGHAVLGVVLALVSADGPATADPLAALYYPALLAAVGATLGVARQGGLIELALARIDLVALRGLRVGLLAVAALLAAGALMLTFGLVTSAATVRELFARNAPGPGSGLGMLLLSVGYLPNAVIAGTSFVAGPGFSLGAVSVGPLSSLVRLDGVAPVPGGPVPGLPLLAALPEESAAWWPLLFALPIGVGVLVGWLLRDVAEQPLARLRAVAVAAGVVALSFVILAGSAGGRLGGGLFDPLSMRAAPLSVALVAWIGITAALVAWLGGPRPVSDGPVGLIDDELVEEGQEPDGEESDEAGQDAGDDDAAVDAAAEDPVTEDDDAEDLAAEVD